MPRSKEREIKGRIRVRVRVRERRKDIGKTECKFFLTHTFLLSFQFLVVLLN